MANYTSPQPPAVRQRAIPCPDPHAQAAGRSAGLISTITSSRRSTRSTPSSFAMMPRSRNYARETSVRYPNSSQQSGAAMKTFHEGIALVLMRRGQVHSANAYAHRS